MKLNRTTLLLLSVAPLVLGLGGSALAADMTVPMYKAPPLAPAYSWSGWYAGVNAGYGVGSSQGNYSVVGLGGPAPTYTFNDMPGGGFAGFQVGYNYQMGSFVLGAETDIQGPGMTDTRTCLLTCLNSGSTPFLDQELTWFGTTRARVGLATGPVLPYITAGVAYGGIKTAVTTTLANGASNNTVDSTTKTGWTWGTGIEAALGGNWTGKVEYLYVDLGTSTVSNVLGPVTASYNTKQQEQIIRGGINYRFGADQSAALATTSNWAGLSVGATFAFDIGRNNSTFMIPGTTADAFYLSPRGFDVGGLLGYNWQLGNWVAGLEADIQDSTGTGYLTCLCGAAVGTSIDQKLSWFGTVRGRVGYAVGPELFYVTGGFAYAEVKDSITQTAFGFGASQSFSHDVSGYVVGGGIESKFDLFGLLGRNWTTRTEYLYMGLGQVTDSFSGLLGRTGTLTSNLTEQVVRTTVTYRFGG